MATDTKVPPYPSGPPTSHPPRKPDEEDDERRIYRNVAVCTRDPIPWIIGRLTLGRADISRLQSSGIPMLLGHVPNEVMGAVMAVRESADVWRSDWTIPKIPATRDTRDRMDTNLLKGISVGGLLDWNSLEITNEDEVNDPDEWIFRADWVMLEQSLTAIPADVRAGIDRTMIARTGPIPDLFIGPDNGIYTPETPEIRQRLDSLMRQHNQNVSIRREQAMTMKPLEQTIPQESIERAIAAQLEQSESLKRFTEVPDKLDQLITSQAEEEQRNMEYRAKLDKLQFQPGGRVLQMDTWDPSLHQVLDLGRVLRLEQQGDLGFPKGEPDTWTLERSFQEQLELEPPGRNIGSRVPWAALEERERQLSLQRATMASGAGARSTDVTVVGNGGLVFAGFAPILARMVVQQGVRGGQKLPWASTQPSAAAGAEGSDIAVSNLVLNNAEFLPKSIASAYELSSSLEASDDGTFQSLITLAIRNVVSEQLVSQVLVGGGTDQISGIWGLTGVPNVDYGAQGEFDRQDALDVLDSVRLSDTDGGLPVMVASKGLWQLMQKTPRGTDGTSSAGYTEIQRFVLDSMMYTEDGVMGMVEGTECHYFSDLKPASVMDPGLVFKASRCVVWLFGNSLALIEVPSEARKTTYKLTAEVNFAIAQPAKNAARVKRT